MIDHRVPDSPTAPRKRTKHRNAQSSASRVHLPSSHVSVHWHVTHSCTLSHHIRILPSLFSKASKTLFRFEIRSWDSHALCPLCSLLILCAACVPPTSAPQAAQAPPPSPHFSLTVFGAPSAQSFSSLSPSPSLQLSSSLSQVCLCTWCLLSVVLSLLLAQPGPLAHFSNFSP